MGENLRVGRTDTVVTFLFTDIEGSTRLLRNLGDAYARVLNQHRRILRRVFAEYDGDEFGDNEGDAFFVSFDDAARAVNAAIDAQRAVARHSWPPGGEVKVRIGIHSGPVKTSPTGMSGMALHEAARVRDTAHGGQIVLSSTTVKLMDDRLPAAAALTDLGTHRLRDIADAVQLFQLDHPDLTKAFPPLRLDAVEASTQTPGPQSVRVLLVDDQEMVRAGFRMILEARAGITVVGEAGDGEEAVARAAAVSPDVILMDIRMPTMDGVEATRRILGTPPPHPKILILTTFDLDEYVLLALEAGASGFMLKDAPPDDLVHAIGVVARGDALLAPTVTRRLIEQFTARGSNAAAAETVNRLTEREADVLRLVARGRSNAEIARDLIVSENTVKGYVSSMLAKLNVRDRVQAVVLAYEAGVVRPGDLGGGGKTA